MESLAINSLDYCSKQMKNSLNYLIYMLFRSINGKTVPNTTLAFILSNDKNRLKYYGLHYNSVEY